ncbi:hypothetical protein B0H13DRAFT_2316121 [Mycena leptocephala]|nr:hypothetical protein B0H13DRAFT_2316121 [Mycena leptocephala]
MSKWDLGPCAPSKSCARRSEFESLLALASYHHLASRSPSLIRLLPCLPLVPSPLALVGAYQCLLSPLPSARARTSTAREPTGLFDASDAFLSRISYTDISCVCYLDFTRSQRRLDAHTRDMDGLSIPEISMTFCGLVMSSLNSPLLSGILAKSRSPHMPGMFRNTSQAHFSLQLVYPSFHGDAMLFSDLSRFPAFLDD